MPGNTENAVDAASGAVLRLDGVAKLYGGRLVFRDLSLEVRPAAVLLVAGPNGAGKSTLLRIMAGLSRPSAGRVERRVAVERMAYLGHHTFLYPQLTALENLRFWARLHGLHPSHEDLAAALSRMELLPAAMERAGRFSRGMAQRLNLARVLLLAPDLLFLDEPGAGLDVRSTGILAAEITAARARGAAVVWVSHHLDRDVALADTVLEIDKGAAAFLGPARDYQGPASLLPRPSAQPPRTPDAPQTSQTAGSQGGGRC